jgi:hypothetical protein
VSRGTGTWTDRSRRIVAVYRGDAAGPYEQYVWHNAGLGELGGSSYIDSLILRDRDADLDENVVPRRTPAQRCAR